MSSVPVGRRRGIRRSSLATRISLLSLGIVVLTGLIAGVLSVNLIRRASQDDASKVLKRLADVSQAVASDTVAGQEKLRAALQESNIRFGLIRSNGTVERGAVIARQAVQPGDVATLRQGRSVSTTRTIGGRMFLVEERPVSNRPGALGVVLAQAKKDAVAQDDRAVRRVLLALVIAGAIALAIALLVAWRMSRSLKRAAAAALAVAHGARDITVPAEGPTEVAEVSEAVNSIVGALRHSETRQRQFLLSVSHDLRTPLTAITGYAESLADGVVPAEETAYVGSVVLGESKRLGRLVGDLLDLARLDAQDFRIDLAQVDLVPAAEAAARVWTSRAAGSGVEVRFEAPPHPVPVVTDVTRLRQALDGLFDNALRVTPAGAPIVLAVRVEQPRTGQSHPGHGSQVPVVEVRDGGPGLADEDLPVAFEQGVLFDRYRGVRQVGTGLGLAIVHGLVTRLGGTIEAGHAQEGGARFTIRLSGM